jgi:hypothetical protein
MSTTKTNAALLQALATHADDVALSVSREKFPILLRKLAERRQITSVEFRPLLVDAMLTTHTHGFRIFFNSGSRDPEELESRYYGESTQQLTETRIRFSLAHEFAHTLILRSDVQPTANCKNISRGRWKNGIEQSRTKL